jgi:hypothetical protein
MANGLGCREPGVAEALQRTDAAARARIISGTERELLVEQGAAGRARVHEGERQLRGRDPQIPLDPLRVTEAEVASFANFVNASTERSSLVQLELPYPGREDPDAELAALLAAQRVPLVASTADLQTLESVLRTPAANPAKLPRPKPLDG